MRKIVKCLVAALVWGVAVCAPSAFAGGLAEVQAALNQLYPEWTASNVGVISGNGNRDCGLHNGVISIHPLSTAVPATLTRVGPITGTYPVLHLRVASVANATKNSTAGDWVLKGRINGLPFFADTQIASVAVKDFKFPLAAWANTGDVKIELDNAAGGYHNWNWELGFWHLIEIVEDESAYRNANVTTVQTALDEKFPGWRVDAIEGSTGVGAQLGLKGNAVVSHPMAQGTPCILSRTVELTGAHPVLVVKVASHVAGTTIYDWAFSAEINREIVIPRQEIRTQEVVEFRYPLERWLGQGQVEIRLFNWNGGSHNAWSCEWAYWHQIDIVEGQLTGEPALRYSYLKGQGRQFINTGYLTRQTSVFDVKMWEPGTGQATPYTAVFAGGQYNDFGAIGFWDRSSSKGNVTFGFAQAGVAGGAFIFEKWVDLNVDVPNALASWCEEGQTTPSTIEGTSGSVNCIAPVFIFTRDFPANGTTPREMTANTEFSLMRLHEFRVREGDTEKIDLVPYRRADGFTGLLDELTGTFYPNVGSGEFLVGGMAYTLDGTRLIAHEGVAQSFDIKPTYTAIEKVSAGVLNLARHATLPPLTVTEGVVDFAGGATRTYQVNGTLTVAGGAGLGFGVGATGCDAVTTSGLVFNDVDAAHPVTIVLSPAGATELAPDAVCPLLTLGEDQRNLDFFHLETGLPVALEIRDGQLVAVPAARVRTLPAGYTAISCIRSTGTQFISTGVEGTEETVVDLTFSGLKPVQNTALLGMDNWSCYNYLVDVLSYGLCFFGRSTAGGTLLLPLAEIDEAAHYHVSIAGGWTYFNVLGGSQTIQEDENSLASVKNREFFLFGINNATPHLSSYSLEACKIMTARGELLRDFQPCRTPDGEAGLWDFVEGVFYGNEGTGHFYGPDEDGLALNYIRSSGTQYIKTGFDAQTNTKVELDFGQVVAQSSAADNGAIFGKGAWTDKCFLLDILNGKLSFWGYGARPGYGTDADSAPLIDPNDRYLVRVADSRVTLVTNGGDPLMSSDANDIANARTGDLTFFALSTGAHPSQYSFYSAKIWDGSDVLVRDLVPWRNDDGRVGLIDRANGNAFLGNSGTGDFAYGYAYALSGEKICIHDGVVTAADDLTAYTEVEKVGWYELRAGEKTSYPGALTISKGTYSLVNDAAAQTTVAGALTVKGGTKLCFDLTATGCDTLAASSFALVDASAENPVRIQLEIGENVDYSRPFTLIASGVSTEALDAFTLLGDVPLSLAVDNGALVLRYKDPTIPVVSVWTNGTGDGELANPANWASTNGMGQAISAIPTSLTLVRIPDGCTFNCPAGSSFAYSEIALPASIGGDCDWTGLPVPIDGTVDLRGHNLRLANLNGTGTITDSIGGLYQRLDYLQTDGTAYINTGYAHKYNTRVDIQVAFHAFPASNIYRCFFGARTSARNDGQFCGWVHTKADGTPVHYAAVNALEKDTTIVARYDTPYQVHLDNSGACTIDGEVFDSGVAGANTLVDYLFGINVNDRLSDVLPQCRIYSCKIYTGETLERDFVPVRRVADGVLGMLDQAHDVFYPNSNTSGAFFAGDIDPTDQAGGTVCVTVPEGETLTAGGLKFTGVAKLLKDGAGMLVWSQGTVDASASVIVTNGVFRFALSTQQAASTAFGTSGSFKVAGQGQLDINGLTAKYNNSPVYSRTLFLAGEGPDGTGALVSTSSLATGGNLVGRIVLTGDTTIGGTQRVDISGVKAEVYGPAYTLTIKNWPYFVYNDGTSITVAAIDVVGHADIAFNNSSVVRLTAPNGLTLHGGNFSTWQSGKRDVALPESVAINVGAEGGLFSVFNSYGTATVKGPLTVKDGGTFHLDLGTVSFANVTNTAGSTFTLDVATAAPSFTGILHNDGTIAQNIGTINYTTNAVVTGSGTIEMTGGTASLGADASAFAGTLRLIDGTLSATGLGSFANSTVIDVSTRTDTFNVTGKNWNVAPAGSTVKVDLGERRVGGGLKVLAWDAAPVGVKFASANGMPYTFIAKEDGLYAYSGLMIILK